MRNALLGGFMGAIVGIVLGLFGIVLADMPLVLRLLVSGCVGALSGGMILSLIFFFVDGSEANFSSVLEGLSDIIEIFVDP